MMDHFLRLVQGYSGMPSKRRLRAFEGTPFRGSENDLSGSIGSKHRRGTNGGGPLSQTGSEAWRMPSKGRLRAFEGTPLRGSGKWTSRVL